MLSVYQLVCVCAVTFTAADKRNGPPFCIARHHCEGDHTSERQTGVCPSAWAFPQHSLSSPPSLSPILPLHHSITFFLALSPLTPFSHECTHKYTMHTISNTFSLTLKIYSLNSDSNTQVNWEMVFIQPRLFLFDFGENRQSQILQHMLTLHIKTALHSQSLTHTHAYQASNTNTHIQKLPPSLFCTISPNHLTHTHTHTDSTKFFNSYFPSFSLWLSPHLFPCLFPFPPLALFYPSLVLLLYLSLLFPLPCSLIMKSMRAHGCFYSLP